MATVHPTAIVEPTVTLADDVTIGPYCVVGGEAELGSGVRLESHVVVGGRTRIGPRCHIYPFSAIGLPPQDLKYKGEPTRLEIGSGNRIREFVTISRGTEEGGGVTIVGDDSLFMVQTHVGHDCRVGNRIVFGNAATLAGHVEVGDDASVGAYSGVHQFCRVARHAFIGGYSVVTRDALPWVLTVGNRAKAFGLNTVGLGRKGYPAEVVEAIKQCYTLLFRSKMPLEEATQKVEAELGHVDEVRYFIDFVRDSKRGICR